MKTLEKIRKKLNESLIALPPASTTNRSEQLQNDQNRQVKYK